MSATKVPYGKPVKLLVDYQGYPDGRLVRFEIWRKKGGDEKEISNVYGVTKNGKGIGWWIPLVDRKGVLSLKETINYQGEEEKFYFIGKIDGQEVKSGDLVFVYPLEVYLEDDEELPIESAECTVTFSDGSSDKKLLKGGRAEFEEAPVGKFEIEVEGYEFVFKPPGKIIKARWGTEKARCGEEVKMIVDVEDFDDGTPARFTIWEKDADGQNDRIEEIEGNVQGNKVEAVWTYSVEEAKEDLKEDIQGGEEEPEFFFVVDIEGMEEKSQGLKFTYLLEIELKDEEGEVLEGDVDYIITFVDKTEKKGTSEGGKITIEDAPLGKYTLKVDGYDFVF
jgi:hypothetical protein